MRIGSNILSLQAQHALERTSKAFAKALERLASGSRINRAGDDAAGLAISTGLDAQVRAYRQGVRNLNDAQAFLDSADGYLDSLSSILQRMRELAVQASSGTYSSDDREYMDLEFQQLFEEYQSQKTDSSFNGTPLFSEDQDWSIQVGPDRDDSIKVSLNQIESPSDLSRIRFLGTYGSLTKLTSSYSAIDPIAMDLDQDGDNDLVYADSFVGGNQYVVSLNDGAGNFSTPATHSTVSLRGFNPITRADFNEDGKEDAVLVSSQFYQFDVLLSQGDGTLARSQLLDPPGNDGTSSTTALVMDVNADGHLDILSFRNSATPVVQTYLGNGNGTFSTGSSQNLDFPLAGYVFGDVNNDGVQDLVSNQYQVGGTTIGVMLGNANGTFKSASTFVGSAIATASGNIRLLDYNLDGNLDLVSVYDQKFSDIRLGNGDGSFQSTPVMTRADSRTQNVYSYDFNRDGIEDILWFDSNVGIRVDLGNGDGTYKTSATQMSVGTHMISQIVDLNGDQIEDFLFRDGGTPGASAILANSTTDYFGINVRTQEFAQDSISSIDTALESLLAERAELGAQRNRLESAASVSSLAVENLSQARSQILDADYAEETAELTRQQILQQAGVSVLAQANSQMQIALALLANLTRK